MNNFKIIIGQTYYHEMTIVEFTTTFGGRSIKLYTRPLMCMNFNYPKEKTITIHEEEWQELTGAKITNYISQGKEMMRKKRKAAEMYEVMQHFKGDWMENLFTTEFENQNKLCTYTLKIDDELRLKIESEEGRKYDYTLYTIEEDLYGGGEACAVQIAEIELSSQMFYNLFKKLKSTIDKWFDYQEFQPKKLNLQMITEL